MNIEMLDWSYTPDTQVLRCMNGIMKLITSNNDQEERLLAFEKQDRFAVMLGESEERGDKLRTEIDRLKAELADAEYRYEHMAKAVDDFKGEDERLSNK